MDEADEARFRQGRCHRCGAPGCRTMLMAYGFVFRAYICDGCHKIDEEQWKQKKLSAGQ